VLDTSTELGARVYQLVKDQALSWSIGYRVPKNGRRRRGAITELVEIDLAEISAVPTPAAEGTRTLSIKSVTTDELRRESLALAAEALSEAAATDYAELREESRALAAETLASVGLVAESPPSEEHKRAASRVPIGPPTRIEMTPWGTYREVDARDPSNISPGVRATGGLMPTPNETKQANKEAERRREEERERKEHDRREAEALRTVRDKYRRESWIVVNGIRMHPADVRFR
jgi:hypothetical protein